jgi:hypothetical protein
MLYKLKEAKVLLSLILVLTWVIGGGLGYLYHASNVKKLSAKDTQIVKLDASIKQVGELVDAYTVATDVKMGKKIEEVDLVAVKVPISMATNLVRTQDDLIGKYYKLNLTAGTAINTDAVFGLQLTDDMRLFDLVLHNIPVGLKVGSFVDVRIALPLGEDFIAIPHKQVRAINAGVVKLAINEQDIHTYNSMLIDALVYPGTQLYAVEYLEGGVQKAADSFYPVSKNILAIAQKDPNLINAIKSDIMQRRDALETGLAKIQPADGRVKESLDLILQRGRDKYRDSVIEAERESVRTADKQAELDKEAQRAAEAAAASTKK